MSFAHPSGVDILHRLVKDCDVLVENYLPGALKKYGMDYESVSQVNSGIIYASITGYGHGYGNYNYEAIENNGNKLTNIINKMKPATKKVNGYANHEN